MSVMIKCQGWWTNTLYDLIQTELNKGADKRKGIPVAIEGPYGPAALDFLKYDSVLMVAGGSGITPFLSILAEIDSTTNRNKFPSRIELVHVIKRAQDICLLHSIAHLLVNQTSEKFHLKLKLFVTQETQPGMGITELLNDTLIAIVLRWRRLKKGVRPTSQTEIKPLDLSSAETKNALEEHEVHFGGRPNFKDILGKFKNETSGSNVGVLVCGPESMKESVAAACQQESECSKLS
ncbi:ferric reduction oxidase mitochondrial-like, partial [Trifolium pratense]